MDEARRLHDQLIAIAPILMALSATKPTGSEAAPTGWDFARDDRICYLHSQRAVHDEVSCSHLRNFGLVDHIRFQATINEAAKLLQQLSENESESSEVEDIATASYSPVR